MPKGILMVGFLLKQISLALLTLVVRYMFVLHQHVCALINEVIEYRCRYQKVEGLQFFLCKAPSLKKTVHMYGRS